MHCAKAGQTGSAPQLVDIDGDMEAHRQESLREEGTRERSAENQTAGTCHSGGTEGGKETACGDGGRGCGETDEWGSPIPL